MSYVEKLNRLMNDLRLEKIRVKTKDEKIAIEMEIAMITRELINFRNMR